MEQKKGYQDLTIGPITDTLIKLTMPILGARYTKQAKTIMVSRGKCISNTS